MRVFACTGISLEPCRTPTCPVLLILLCWMYTLTCGNRYALVVFRRKRDIYGGELPYPKVDAVILRVDFLVRDLTKL